MLRVDLDFLPTPRDHDVAIVIDVLRMTTTAAAMLAGPRREVAIVADVEAALNLAARTGALLYGERQGVALPGFDGGNSPLEHVGGGAKPGDRVVLCTTNGSRAVESAVGARHLLLGAIVNAGAVARAALARASNGVTLVCAGTEGRVSLDDVLAAGYLLRAMASFDPSLTLSDACRIALDVAAADPDPVRALERAQHASTLYEIGFGDDVRYAGRLDHLGVVAERVANEPATFRAVDRSA